MSEKKVCVSDWKRLCARQIFCGPGCDKVYFSDWEKRLWARLWVSQTVRSFLCVRLSKAFCVSDWEKLLCVRLSKIFVCLSMKHFACQTKKKRDTDRKTLVCQTMQNVCVWLCKTCIPDWKTLCVWDCAQRLRVKLKNICDSRLWKNVCVRLQKERLWVRMG